MTVFDVCDENFEARIGESFARQGFMKYLGARLSRVAAGEIEIEVPHDNNLTQQHGYFHGGLIGTIADNAGGYAAYTLMAATDSVLTVEYKLNILAPAKGDLLIARGRVTRAGRRVNVCQSDVFIVNGKKEKLCATMLGTFMTMENTSDLASK